ncbi:MAG: hypothetical protein ACFFG0_15990 [Candidatus Thorarchaeota archaeon]
MKINLKLDFDELIDQHTLLYGETNTNKTYQTSKFVQFLLESKKVPSKDISILDFAPNFMKIKNMKIGGKIEDFYEHSITCKNILFNGEIIPPRLNSGNKTELYQNACENFKKTSKILHIYRKDPTPILIINDISLYLHIGNIKLLLGAISKSNTFFGNSYYGSSIKRDYATLFSLREKRQVKYLIKKLDKSYFTG